MLRTNSKEFKSNLENYIIEHFNAEDYLGYGDYADDYIGDYYDIRMFIQKVFYKETGVYDDFKVWHDWCTGLPSVLDCGFLYNRSAVDDLADLLEITEEEAARHFDEPKAEERLIKELYQAVFATK